MKIEIVHTGPADGKPAETLVKNPDGGIVGHAESVKVTGHDFVAVIDLADAPPPALGVGITNTTQRRAGSDGE